MHRGITVRAHGARCAAVCMSFPKAKLVVQAAKPTRISMASRARKGSPKPSSMLASPHYATDRAATASLSSRQHRAASPKLALRSPLPSSSARRERVSREGPATDRSGTFQRPPGSDRWPGYPLHELRAHGYHPVQLRLVGHNASDLKAGGYSAQELKAAGFNAHELKAAKFRASELRSIGFHARDLHEARFRAVELKQAGFSVQELKEVNHTAAEMKAAGYTASELKAAKYRAAELKEAGFTLRQLKQANFKAIRLENQSTPKVNRVTPGFIKLLTKMHF